jgi:tetratricopeptide (TPR) repeat protein
VIWRLRDAMAEFRQARQIAAQSRSWLPLAYTMANLTSLYLRMMNPAAAAATAREALAGPEGRADPVTTITIRTLLATALAEMHRFEEALPIFRQAIFEMENRGEIEKTAGIWSMIGEEAMREHRYSEAETAFTEALRLVRVHHLKNSATILRGLAMVRRHAGDAHSAAVLFDAALAAPPGASVRWALLTDRGSFRLEQGDGAGALRDLREARAQVAALRADMIPADQDRISMEGGIREVLDGLVDAGNTMASSTGDARLLAETFDAAEQDRAWSLRALIPSGGDWRSKLPEHYWETLARYQGLQRTAMTAGDSSFREEATRLSVELAEMETVAAGNAEMHGDGSAVRHVQDLLDADSVLLSFHLGKQEAWVWVVEKNRVEAFPLGESRGLEDAAVSLSKAIREGTASPAASHDMFRRLFGNIPEPRLRHRRWLLELDQALFGVPFGALVVEKRKQPVYLIERAAIQTVPGALLLKRGSVPKGGAFIGVGDAVYNTADSRYRGNRKAVQLTLPRLPNTAAELESCAREWNPAVHQVLTGMNATEKLVRQTMQDETAVLHFATHVVTAPEDNQAGMIAMSLNAAGAMELLGAKEILTHPVKTALVVMNGCHSAQGAALPGTGLVGLTRAWIGAGAGAVLATQWDIPDAAAQDFMKTFYRSLRTTANFDPAVALQQAQLENLKNPQNWAGYFLLSRII